MSPFPFTTALIVFLMVNTGLWLLRHLMISRVQRGNFSLDSKYPVSRNGAWPKVSVLVAARNESANIGRCLQSLLRQDYDQLEIIAINDRSEDDTGQIIDRLADESGGRLRALHVGEVSAGWLGKSNAMGVGVEHASGDWLCFTDADCCFVCPDAIRISVGFAQDRDIDLLSVLPVLETVSFWERVVQPVCSAILMVWFRPESVNDPSSGRAYANGAFMLFRRSCYEAMGGHEEVRSDITEDMAFARLAKDRGHKLFVVGNSDLYRTRMYEDFRSMFHGWSRIFYGCFNRLGWIVAASVLLWVMSLVPHVVFIGGLAVATAHSWSLSDAGWYAVMWAGLAIVAQMSVIVRFYRLLGLGWVRALGYPLGAAVAASMLVNATGKFFGGGIVWRGRVIRTKSE